MKMQLRTSKKMQMQVESLMKMCTVEGMALNLLEKEGISDIALELY
jgi:hypothetical protein